MPRLQVVLGIPLHDGGNGCRPTVRSSQQPPLQQPSAKAGKYIDSGNHVKFSFVMANWYYRFFWRIGMSAVDVMRFFGDSSWWISVVIVGIAINFFSAYSKGWIDSGLGKISEKWKNSSDRRKQSQQGKIEELARSEYLRTKAMVTATYVLIRGVSFQVLALIGIYMAVSAEKMHANGLFLGIGCVAIVCLSMSMAAVVTAASIRKSVESADKLNLS